MNNKHTFLAGEEDEGKRIDNFLSEIFASTSRTQIQNIIKNKQVFINNASIKPSYSIKENDFIEIEFSQDEKIIIEPENIQLDIKYEDETMLVVNKPKNMLTHPTTKEFSGTLVNALLHKFGREGLSTINGEMRPGILHRLDRNTSGLLMVAKTNEAHHFLTDQIKTKTAIRKYLAVVKGNFDKTEGTITKDISRHPSKPEKMAVVENGKPSVTHYKVLEEFKGYSFIELTLETGRTHQIRVHLKSIDHPIVNDSLYGGPKIKVKTTEQVLQAYNLTFTTPVSGDIINIEIDPDDDIKKTLNFLRSKK